MENVIKMEFSFYFLVSSPHKKKEENFFFLTNVKVKKINTIIIIASM